MKYPYSYTELEKMKCTSHSGVCKNCSFPKNSRKRKQTKEKARSECQHCRRLGIYESYWRFSTPDGTSCEKCNNSLIPVFSKYEPSLLGQSELDVRKLCLNCHIQEHQDYCGKMDEEGNITNCDGDWPKGAE